MGINDLNFINRRENQALINFNPTLSTYSLQMEIPPELIHPMQSLMNEGFTPISIL